MIDHGVNVHDGVKIKLHTKQIAINFKHPFIKTTMGSVRNPMCHIHESYSVDGFKKIACDN